jgi:hypothetical protein
VAERIGRDNQGRYRMPPASSHGLRSDTLSSGRIIVQPPAIFKSLRLSRSALTSRSTLTVRHTHSQTTRAMSLPGPNATNPTHVPASALRGRPEMVGARLNRREWSRPSSSPTVCLVSRAKLIAEPATSAEGRRLAIPNMRIDPANSSSRPPAIPRGAGSAYGGSMIPSTGRPSCSSGREESCCSAQ